MTHLELYTWPEDLIRAQRGFSSFTFDVSLSFFIYLYI